MPLITAAVILCINLEITGHFTDHAFDRTQYEISTRIPVASRNVDDHGVNFREINFIIFVIKRESITTQIKSSGKHLPAEIHVTILFESHLVLPWKHNHKIGITQYKT